MNFVVVGCGRVGAELAYRLFQKEHKVTVIDNNPSAFNNLPVDFLGRTVEGEALNRTVLHRAGIEQADGIAVVTNSDALNAVVAHIARVVYKISNIVVRNYDPAYRDLHEAFNLQVISSSSWGAQRIEELLYHLELRTVYSAGNGEIEVYEFSVPKSLAGKPLGDLLPAGQCSPVGLTRAGRAFLPNCDTILEECDIVILSATFEGISSVRQHLGRMQEG